MSAANVVHARPGERFGVGRDLLGFVVVDLERGAEPVKVGPGVDGHFYGRPDAELTARQMSRCEPVHSVHSEPDTARGLAGAWRNDA